MNDDSCEIAIRWMSLNLTDDELTMVQVMAWCHQATSHYLNQCWPRFFSHMGSLGHNEFTRGSTAHSPSIFSLLWFLSQIIYCILNSSWLYIMSSLLVLYHGVTFIAHSLYMRSIINGFIFKEKFNLLVSIVYVDGFVCKHINVCMHTCNSCIHSCINCYNN